jgi:polysaccharide export outer membrane protein
MRLTSSPARPTTDQHHLADDPENLQPTQPIALVQYIDEEISQRNARIQVPAPVEFQSGLPVCDSCGDDCGASGHGRQQCSRCELLPVPMGCNEQAPGPVKGILGVNEDVCRRLCREPTFQDSQIVPWEMFAYGEYIGPHRTPHVPEYRLRVDDRLEFVFCRSRKQSPLPYQIYVGDTITISSATDSSINQEKLVVLSDGTISLPLIGQVQAAGKTVAQLQDALNNLYLEYMNDPAVLVQVVAGNTPLNDIIDSIDATQGIGGQVRRVLVSPDGTIQLPVIGLVPAVGLTLEEIRREVNARYRMRVTGLELTPILLERAPRFIYVLGQVTTPGRYELTAPTTVLQSIALAEGDLQGGNLRNIVVLRRDENWRLTATRLDLAGAVHGRRPLPTDEMFLRDSDIVIVPRKPIQRLSEAVDLYFTRTLYGIYPRAFLFDIDGVATF